MAVLCQLGNAQMAHRGISAAVVGCVMALGIEFERNLMPNMTGSSCSSREALDEEANISSSTRGKARHSVTCYSRILDFNERKEGK